MAMRHLLQLWTKRQIVLSAHRNHRWFVTSVVTNANTSSASKHRPVVDNASTIDDNEIKHFDRLARKFWDPTGPLSLLHQMNKLRVPLIRDALVTTNQAANPLNGKWIADVGCGAGILSEPLARLGAFVLALDASADNINVAQRHAMVDPTLSTKIKYIHGTVEDAVLTNAGKFDGVVASEVVEHIADQQKFVKMCCDMLKPGGSLIITTLNKTPISYFSSILVAEYLLRIVPVGTHDYEKFIHLKTLEKMLVDLDMEIMLSHGFIYNILFGEWSWTKQQDIHYAIIAKKGIVED